MLTQVAVLASRYFALEAEIARARREPRPNELEVMRLKMEKLRVGDELKAIERMNSPVVPDHSPPPVITLKRAGASCT